MNPDDVAEASSPGRPESRRHLPLGVWILAAIQVVLAAPRYRGSPS
jgi:hypothetical protein